MDVTVTADGAGEQDLWSLRDSLGREPELRGRSRPLRAPRPGTMGAAGEALRLALEPGGAVAAFAAVGITWLRLRAGSVRLRVTREDGSSVELLADRVRDLDAQAVRQQVSDLARFLAEDPGQDAGEAPGR